MGHAAPCCSLQPPPTAASLAHQSTRRSCSLASCSRLLGIAWTPRHASKRAPRSIAAPPTAGPQHWQFSAPLPPSELSRYPSQGLERQLSLSLQRQGSQALAAAAVAEAQGCGALGLPPQMLDAAAACVGVAAVACQLGGAPGAPGGLDGPSSFAATILAMAAWMALQWLLEAAWDQLRAARLPCRGRRALSKPSNRSSCGSIGDMPLSEGQELAHGGSGSPDNWSNLLLKAAGCLLDLRTGTALDPWLRGVAVLVGLCEAGTLLSEWADKPVLSLLERTTSLGL